MYLMNFKFNISIKNKLIKKILILWFLNFLFLGNPRDAVEFALPLRAQQVSDPVAEQFSLNTTFSLLSKKDLWTADSAIQVTESSDVAFPEG
jgi:hypothetical protein